MLEFYPSLSILGDQVYWRGCLASKCLNLHDSLSLRIIAATLIINVTNELLIIFSCFQGLKLLLLLLNYFTLSFCVYTYTYVCVYL